MIRALRVLALFLGLMILLPLAWEGALSAPAQVVCVVLLIMDMTTDLFGDRR